MLPFYAVIMAGGGGTRLWPLSRRRRPKHTLAFFNERTLFQNTVYRLWGLMPAEHILVITVEEQQALLREQAPGLPEGNIIAEPLPRGTAAAAALAWLALRQRGVEDAVMAVLPSDHYVASVHLFQRLLRAAYQVALEDRVVTIGIRPSYPATGYGYIQLGEPLGEYLGFPAHRVRRFKEKPSRSTAERFLTQGDHVWNAGIFVWKASVFHEELHRWMPRLARAADAALEQGLSVAQPETLRPLWEELVEDTIDYGIMEKTQRAAVLPAPQSLGWNDIGSWDAVFDLMTDSKQKVYIQGAEEHIVLESEDLMVYLDDRPRLVVSIGVQEVLVVLTEDALLLCRRGESQRVKDVVRTLRDLYPQYT